MVAVANVLGMISSRRRRGAGAADGEGAFLVAGVDEAVEAFGGVFADGQHADVVGDDQVDSDDVSIALLTLSSARCRRTRAPSSPMENQATVRPVSLASWSRASQKWLLPVPDGPQMHRSALPVPHAEDLCIVEVVSERKRSLSAATAGLVPRVRRTIEPREAFMHRDVAPAQHRCLLLEHRACLVADRAVDLDLSKRDHVGQLAELCSADL